MPCIVGVYSPVGVDKAMLISACGRTVRVGLPESDEVGVIDDRRRGHSIIAFESVLRRIGRKVIRVNRADDGVEGRVGAE